MKFVDVGVKRYIETAGEDEVFLLCNGEKMPIKTLKMTKILVHIVKLW